MSRIQNGLNLMKSSFDVLMSEKKLLIFPLISFFSLCLVVLTFLLPVLLTGAYIEGKYVASWSGVSDALIYIYMFVFYVINYFIIIFCNCALIGCALKIFEGEQVSIKDGFDLASRNLYSIFIFSLMSATVGVLLKALQNNSNTFGQIVSGLIGVAWSVATYFVAPILVTSQLGPVQAMKKSMRVLKKTWGESLTGNFGLGLISFIIFGISFFLSYKVIAISVATKSIPIIASAVFFCASLIGLLFLIQATLSGILLAALYSYARSDELPTSFDQNLVNEAFVPSS